MRKMFLCYLGISILLSVILCGCNLTKNEWHPIKSVMSKWEGDGIELYILDDDINNGKDLIFIDSGDGKLVFDVLWQGNGLWNLEMLDRRMPKNEDGSTLDGDLHEHTAGSFGLTILKEGSCLLKPYVTCHIPENMLSDKIVLQRTVTDLNPEDIPEIKLNDKYGFCPTYRYGSQWLSEDEQISISILPQKKAELGIGKILFDKEPNADLYIKFHEYNSMAYVGGFSENTHNFYVNIRDAQEQWQCEYFEDYFTATVVCSGRYPTGQVIRFNRIQGTRKHGERDKERQGDGSPVSW